MEVYEGVSQTLSQGQGLELYEELSQMFDLGSRLELYEGMLAFSLASTSAM